MKKIIYVFFGIIMFSCHHGESMEVFIKNLTSEKIIVNFVSKDFRDLNKTLEIGSNEQSLYTSFQSANTGVYLTLVDNDSIYIQNSSNEVLKVYKANTPGKNIYNVDEYWQKREPSKNFFEYTYEITEEDLK